MNESPDKQIANMEEGVALPRKNGELVFEAPWEGQDEHVCRRRFLRGMLLWRDGDGQVLPAVTFIVRIQRFEAPDHDADVGRQTVLQCERGLRPQVLPVQIESDASIGISEEFHRFV